MLFPSMNRRGRVRCVCFLLSAFVLLGGLAIQGHRRADAYQRYLANSYRHAYAELASNLSQLDADLQKGLYATSPAMLGSLCTQIFGKAMAAQMAVGELPYGNIELEQTASFLAKTGDYAAYLARTAAVNGGCTEEQRQTLRALSSAASTLSSMVAGLQTDLDGGTAALEDLQTVQDRLSAITEDGRPETAGSSFQTIESDFPELPSLIYDGPFSEHIAGRQAQMLAGLAPVSQDDARLAAANFLGLKPEIFSLVSASDGQLPTYGFTATVDGGELYVDVSRTGGLVTELFSSRTPGPSVLSPQEAVAVAAQFLVQRGYPDMKETYYIAQGGMLTIHFAALQEGVLCYPDLVKVSVALDTGKIMGFEAQGYLMNHRARVLPSLAVSAEEARQALSDGLEVLACQLTLIPTGGEYEVFCHEFKCQTPEGQHILVYLNAQTGQEERILILLEDETGTLVI